VEHAERLQTESPLVIKAFEEPVLVRGIGEALGRLRKEVELVASVWDYLVAT